MSVQTPEIEQAYEKHETNWFALPALRNNRAREIYSRLRGDLIRRFAALSKPDEALLRFEQFLSGLPSGVQLFSLFENQPTLLDLLVDICAVSPALAEYLGQNKSVLDAVLDQNFFEPFDTLDVMKAGLDQRLAGTDDYEYALDEIRRWQKERHFRNGVHLLRGISTHEEVAHVYSSLAEISISAALPLVERNLGRRFGPPPGRGAAILAMGRLGSREMTARSDLDLIVVYDGAGQSETNGPKSISVGAYYSRFTQALISALTVPTSEGRLYEVDLRLRPSGRKGPVATSLTAFADYQLEEAWTWEHLALTRARVVSGSASLGADVAQAIERALAKPRDAGETQRDISNMRAKLAAAFNNNPETLWETKKGPGGLLDIELFLQSGVLLCGGVDGRTPNETIPQLLSAGWLSDEEATGLLETHKLLSGIQHVERLVGPEFDPLNGSQLQKEMLLRVLGEDDVKNLLEKKVAFVKSSDSIITQRVAG